MTPFSGLWVGGPLDSKTVTQDKPRFYVVKLNDLPESISHFPPLDVHPAETTRIEYVYTFLRIDDETFGLWHPTDVTPKEAIRQLFRGYKP